MISWGIECWSMGLSNHTNTLDFYLKVWHLKLQLQILMYSNVCWPYDSEILVARVS